MKTVLIYDGDNLQIDFVPETDHDKAVLATLKEGDTFEVGKASGYAKCQGGYLRPFGEKEDVKFTYIKRDPKAAPDG